MKVKDLRKLIEGVDDNMNVIVTGEYDYGIPIYSGRIAEFALINDNGDIGATKPRLALYVDSYLREHEDIGECEMYVDAEDAEEYRRGNEENEEDE